MQRLLVATSILIITLFLLGFPSARAQIADNGVAFVGAGDIAACSVIAGAQATAALIDTIPGTVFTAGDNAYNSGTAQEFTDCYGPTWGRFKARTRPAPGNHDYVTNASQPYHDYFGPGFGVAGAGYYSFDLGAWHIIILDSNVSAINGSAQINWLVADLAAHRVDCTLAIWHHPYYSSGIYGNDARWYDFWTTLYNNGADIVINGHEHDYERFAPQNPNGGRDDVRGIREFIVGTGGASLRNFNVVQANSEVRYNSTHGVLKLMLYSTGYSWQFIPVSGTFTDSGTTACSPLKKPQPPLKMTPTKSEFGPPVFAD